MDEPPLPGEIFGKDSDSFVGIFVNACEMPKLTYNLRQHFSYMYCVLGCPQKFLLSIKTVDRKTLAAVVVVGGGCYSTTVHCKYYKLSQYALIRDLKKVIRGRDMFLVGEERASIPCVNVRLLTLAGNVVIWRISHDARIPLSSSRHAKAFLEESIFGK